MCKTNVFLLILLCAFFLTVSSVSAEEELELQDVTITASPENEEELETQGFITVINAEQIRDSGAADIGEVLSSEAGISIKEYGAAGAEQNISVRGSTSEQVLVLVDGRRQNSAQSGLADLSLIPLENIERIEIIRGSAAVLYGADAVGGVINIVTRKTTDKKLQFTLSAENGSYLPLPHVAGFALNKTERDPFFPALVDTQKVAFFLGKDFGGPEVSLSGGFKRAGNSYVFRDTNNEDRIRENAGLISGNAAAGVKIPWADNSLTISASWYQDSKGVPGTVTSPSLEGEQSNSRADGAIDFSSESFFSKSLTLDFCNSFTYTRKQYSDPGLAVDSDHQLWTYLGRLSQEMLFFDSFSAEYGMDGGYNYLDSTDSGQRERWNLAGFVQVPVYVNQKLTLEPSARFDYYSDFGESLTWSLGVVYKLSDKLSLKTSASRSFRAPSFDDLYWPADAWAEGNPDLVPETGYNFDFGFVLAKKNLHYNGFLFARYVDDVILWQPGTDDIWRPSNWGTGLYLGLENSLRISFLKHYSVSINHTFLYSFALSGDYELADNKRLPMLPLNELELSFKYKSGKHTVSASGHYTGIRYLKIANVNYMPSVFTLDLFYRLAVSAKYGIYFRADNVFNEQYEMVSGYPMPGTMLTVGLDINVK